MAEVIICPAADVWDLFQREKPRFLSDMKLIAQNTSYAVEIYLTGEDRGITSFPNIVVMIDDDEVYSEVAVSKRDCEQTVVSIYDEYLSGSNVVNRIIEMERAESGKHEVDVEEMEQQMEIEGREEELDSAIWQFFHDVLGGPLDDLVDSANEIYEDCKDHFLEYMARKWDLTIFRPMILEDEDGEEFYEEYPYECMEFDDEDNPIYN